jgi:hypothetical protein
MARTETQNRPASAQSGAPATNGQTTPETTPAPFDVSFLSAPVVTAQATSVKTLAQPKNKRSEAQMALDKITPQVHKAWVDAGKPAAFLKLPTLSYPVDPERATKLKGMIRKAAEFNGDSGTPTRARFGADVTITPEIVADPAIKGLTEAHVGLTLVTFGIMDKSQRATDENGSEATEK